MRDAGEVAVPTPAEQAGERAARNTVTRTVAEFVGKFATLVLFVALGRSVGASKLGVFVFALAYGQLVVMVIDLGMDRYIVSIIARDHDSVRHVLPAAAIVKAALAVVVVPLSFVILLALGKSSAMEIAVVYILMAGSLLDSAGRIVSSVFIAHERSELLAIGIVVERVVAAAAGVTVLALGFGIVVVSCAYTLGAAVGLAVLVALLKSRMRLPKLSAVRGQATPMALRSVPYAADDILTAMLFKLDAVLLAVLSTNVAVGLYGTAYRLFESTLSIDYSIAGAFGAMYAYLTHDSEPTISAVYQRSIKLALVALIPFAVTFGALAEPLVRLLFGHHLVGAASPLRILAPAQVMLGLVTLSAILIVYRRSPLITAAATGAAVLINCVLNVILIPHMHEDGAALAMLITEALFLCVALVIAVREVGGIELRATALGPLAAGGAMAGVMLALSGSLAPALVFGIAAYLVVLVAVERVTSPQDFRFVAALVRRSLRFDAAA